MHSAKEKHSDYFFPESSHTVRGARDSRLTLTIKVIARKKTLKNGIVHGAVPFSCLCNIK
jgi:hypothetical protein